MQRWAALGCVVIILCAAGLFYARLSAAVGATHTVAIDGVKFDPETIAVKAGDTVVWVNQDPVPHTVTSQAGDSIRTRLQLASRGATGRPGPACSPTPVRFTRRCKQRCRWSDAPRRA